jgi:hypothetical protein
MRHDRHSTPRFWRRRFPGTAGTAVLFVMTVGLMVNAVQLPKHGDELQNRDAVRLVQAESWAVAGACALVLAGIASRLLRRSGKPSRTALWWLGGFCWLLGAFVGMHSASLAV